MRRLLGFVVAVGTIVFLAGAGAVGFVFWKVSQDLPDYEGLAKYEPPVLTRMKYADQGDARLLRRPAERGGESRWS